MITWRQWEDPDGIGAQNMAWDYALAAESRPEQAVLRFYGWASPTVSLGRNQAARHRYDLELAASLGVDFVRRPTGGAAVLHHQEVTYAVVVPLRAFGGPRNTFHLISEGLLQGVRALGVPAELSRDGQTSGPPTAERFCFGVRAPGELSVGGHKLLGSAQARIGEALLQHGSLLISAGQEMLSQITHGGGFEGGPPITLEAALGGPVDPGRVRRSLRHSLQAVLGGDWAEGHPTVSEAAVAARLEATYRDSAWTWRR